MKIILSLFPGIGLLDRAFEQEGFSVVRGPDLLWGGNIKRFHVPQGVFHGIVGGPPCQCFTRLISIIRHNGYRIGENLVPEFERIVHEAQPDFFVMENVEGAPVPQIAGYQVDTTLLDNRWLGQIQSRKHRFSFGTRDGRKLHYELAALENFDWDYRVCASDGRRTPVRLLAGGKPKNPKLRRGSASCRGTKRTVAQVCKLQGLPEDFLDHSPFTVAGKIQMLGNGVPLFMGLALARAVRQAMRLRVFKPDSHEQTEQLGSGPIPSGQSSETEGSAVRAGDGLNGGNTMDANLEATVNWEFTQMLEHLMAKGLFGKPGVDSLATLKAIGIELNMRIYALALSEGATLEAAELKAKQST
jgi:DNA (cytosine-5)-methyltransferase 1